MPRSQDAPVDSSERSAPGRSRGRGRGGGPGRPGGHRRGGGPGHPAHTPGIFLPSPHLRRVALLGNVNVGKTSLFGRLCLTGVHPVNIPGSTMRVQRGVLAVGPHSAPRSFRRQCMHCSQDARRRRRRFRGGECCERVGTEAGCPALAHLEHVHEPGDVPTVVHLFDTPGAGSLVAESEDEMVSRDLLLSGLIDGVLLVADAKNLRRSLALALEVAEFESPMVIDLNMVDEAEDMGLEVDDHSLALTLGVDVQRTIAVEDIGVRSLAERLPPGHEPRRQVTFPEPIEEALALIEELLADGPLPPRAVGVLLLSGDEGARAWVRSHLGEGVARGADEIVAHAQRAFATPLQVLIADTYLGEAQRIADRVVTSAVRSPNLLVRFGGWAQRPFPGLLIAAAVLLVAYYFIGAFGATFVVDQVSTPLFEEVVFPAFEWAVRPIPSAFVREAVMDPDFGLVPTGLFLAVGIVLPVLFCFYLFQAVLEDTGYFPRLSVLFDRVFRWMGLNGQGLIPLVLGLSCVTMALITTRMLPSQREKILLSLLLMLGLPCAPLLAVMFVILQHLPWTASVVVYGLIATQTLLVGYLASKLMPGALPDLILEIPRMRIPRVRVLLSKTFRRTWHFMREALPVFLLASFVVFVFDRVGGLALLERASSPVVQGLMGLPEGAVQVFIKTAIRREAGATELNLLRDQFTNLQLVVTMLVMTFLVPCINSAIVLVKERGLKVSAAILGIVVVYALTLGTALNWICRGLGITFGG